MAGHSERSRQFWAMLLIFVLGQQAYLVPALLPACGPIENLIPPCFKSVAGAKPYPISPVSDECCQSIRRFRFPGCLCVALVEEIESSAIDEKSAIAALSLPANCGTPLPAGFNCTGFSR